MDNATSQKVSPETRKLFDHIGKALLKAGQEARELAERTNTPLVICQPNPTAKPAETGQER